LQRRRGFACQQARDKRIQLNEKYEITCGPKPVMKSLVVELAP
jgi:hypothetical protein